jgi:hypothetical protein
VTFFIEFRLRNKSDNFQWVLVAVYGAAQPAFKDKFLTELVQTCSNENLPLLVGGDFKHHKKPWGKKIMTD